MSVRNLDAIFRPNAVALIGASNRPGSVGHVTIENLKAGGFAGRILPVNPKYDTVAGLACYRDIAALPVVPDLAVIATPARTVPDLIESLAARGTRGAVVISAGFGELGTDEGHARTRAMLAAAQKSLLRIVGPNCLGVASTPVGLNASFAPSNAKPGGVAFLAQSGAMVTTVLDWANARGIGFSHLVSLGNMDDVDFGDMLDYLASDPETTAVLLYIEAITQARKFLSAARACARLKPVIAIKAGRHEAAARAATSHTGALAGSDAVYDAAFRRAGILRVRELEDVFDAVETLATARPVATDDLVVLTNGGGAGVLATDALLDYGLKPADLSAETRAKLDAVLPQTWSHANPVDIIGDAPPQRYADALTVLLEAPEAHAVLVLNCPTAVASSTDAAEAVIATAAHADRPVLTNWLGAKSAAAARAAFSDAGIATFDTPSQAVRGFAHLVRYRRGQETIREVPSTVEAAPDAAGAVALLAAAPAEGWLDPETVARLLGCYGIAAARVRLAATPDAAAAAAAELSGPVALKIVSPDILHKSDVGGVMLNLEGPEATRSAAEAMRARIAETAPEARFDGFAVQEMMRRPGAYELIAGMAVDRQFGPFLLFGEGGTAVEIVADKALALPPLNRTLAETLIGETRIARLLHGYRDRPPVDMDALAGVLVGLSQMVCDLDAIAELDLNPLLADEHGVIAVDARIRVAPPVQAGRGGRLAIRPYPRDWEKTESLPGLGRATLRPIRPEDAPLLADLIAHLTPEDAALRFRTPVRGDDPRVLARLTQIDYDREMAFVLEQGDGTNRVLLAVARLAADPDNIAGEFAVVVRSDLHRRGLGLLLMQRLIQYGRSRGLSRLFGDVVPENAAMLALCRRLGFVRDPKGPEGLARMALVL